MSERENIADALNNTEIAERERDEYKFRAEIAELGLSISQYLYNWSEPLIDKDVLLNNKKD